MSEYTAPPESPEASVKVESADPFSAESMFKTYQTNIHKSEELIFAITKGAREGVSEHDLLLMAVEAISRMTDNIAFRTVVEKALEERTAAAE